MKILQVLFSLASGGAERFAVDLSNELSKTNDVTLLTLKNDKVDEANRNFYKFDLSERVNYVNLGLGDGAKPIYLWKIYKIIKEIAPDVVHMNGSNMDKYCYLACLLLGDRMTFVQTIHNDLYHGYVSRFDHFAYHTLARCGKLRWAALSDTNFHQLKKEYPKAMSCCIYNGRAPIVPTPKFQDVSKEILALKKDENTKVILHVARCTPQKNQQLLINSMNLLRKEGVNAILLIIGAFYDSEYGKELKKLAGEGIYFLGTRQNVSDYMLNSDVFALSSKFEGMPITLLEAMLSGTPMVSTPVTGAVDVIDGKNGIISNDFSLESYVEALKEMIRHYPHFKEGAIKGKENSPYTIKYCAEQYIHFYVQ